MSKLTIVANIKANPDHIDAGKAELIKLIPITRAEEGCINSFDKSASVIRLSNSLDLGPMTMSVAVRSLPYERVTLPSAGRCC